MMRKLERVMGTLMGDLTKMLFQKGSNRYIKDLNSLMHILLNHEQLQFWRLVFSNLCIFGGFRNFSISLRYNVSYPACLWR